MKNLLYKWLSILFPLFLGIGLVIYKYNDFTPEEIAQMKAYAEQADYFYVFLSLFIALFGFLSRAYRWKYTLGYLGYRPSLANKLLAVCISYFVNLTIPRSGEITRAVIVNKYEGIPFDKAFGTIIAERIVDLLIFFLFVCVALICQFNVLTNYLLEKIALRDLLASMAVVLVLLAFFIVIWIYAKWPLIQLLKQKLSGLVEGVVAIWHMPNRTQFLFHSLFIWGTYLLMFYVMIFSIPATSAIGFGAVFVAFIIGSLAVGITNSGFGAYPILVAEILLLYGVDDLAGHTFGWLVWISQTLLIILLGALSFLLLPIINARKTTQL